MKKLYTPFEGDELDTAVAILQAAKALDAAAQLALECRDVESLAGIAGLWVEISKQLGSKDDVKIMGGDDDATMGFCLKEENE